MDEKIKALMPRIIIDDTVPDECYIDTTFARYVSRIDVFDSIPKQGNGDLSKYTLIVNSDNYQKLFNRIAGIE